MTLVKFQPRAFEQTFNNLVDDFFTAQPSLYRNGAQSKSSFHVPANIVKNEAGYELQLAAPGFEKEAFKVNLEKGLLTVSAEVKEAAAENKAGFVRREFRQQSFKRSWTLDETIDAEKIEARYNNGILVLTLPKKAEVTEPVKQISIQ
jgi:HSP20 family protein